MSRGGGVFARTFASERTRKLIQVYGGSGSRESRHARGVVSYSSKRVATGLEIAGEKGVEGKGR